MAALLMGLAALLPSSAPLAAGTGISVSGKVTLQGERRAPAYEVHVSAGDGSSLRIAFVRSDGTYSIDNLPPGDYRMRVVPTGGTYQGPGPKVTLNGRRERIDLYVLASGRTLLSSRHSHGTPDAGEAATPVPTDH